MKFSIQRESLIQALSIVAGVVERRQTMAILANVLFDIKGNQLAITGTDLEVQMTTRLMLDTAPSEDLQVTLPAKKLLDICKALPEQKEIKLQISANQKMSIQCGKTRFSLSTLPASDFPSVDEGDKLAEFTLTQTRLKSLIDKTSFAMAQQDVRFYLNGMLWELEAKKLRAVSTDGHRLALSDLTDDTICVDEVTQIIVPRKAILELSRILSNTDEPLTICFGHNHLRVTNSFFTFVTKLVDGKFPDYTRVLPQAGDKQIFGNRLDLKDTFTRAAILSNEKYRGIHMVLAPGSLTIQATNPEKEEAEDTVAVDYEGGGLEIGFNVNYLIDVMNILDDEQVKITLADANSSALIESDTDNSSLYVVMPMRL